MASCKDCVHYDVCVIMENSSEDNKENYCKEFNCPDFKDRNRFVELPRRVGDTVYS